MRRCCCKTVGNCFLCKDLIQTNQISKSKITISGFNDYLIDTTKYQNFGQANTNPIIRGSIGFFGTTPVTGFVFDGTAMIRYYLNISGLNQLNTFSEFILQNNKFVPIEKSKFLGEVIVTNFIEHTMSGKGYAFFPRAAALFNCPYPCNSGSPPAAPYYEDQLYETDIPSDWNGKIGCVCKYDFYLMSEEYSCDLGKMENSNRCQNTSYENHMPFDANFFSPMVSFVAVLKETEIIQEGIYLNAGYPSYTDIVFDRCWGESTTCPTVGQQPCEGLIRTPQLFNDCRNPLYGNLGNGFVDDYDGYHINYEIYHKLFLPYPCRIDRFGNLSKPWAVYNYFANHFNFYPFMSSILDLIHKPNINYNNCSIDSIQQFKLIAQSYFSGEANPSLLCEPIYNDPCQFCASYNDAKKEINQKYAVVGFEQPNSQATISGIINIIQPINHSNYFKILSSCDNQCGNIDTSLCSGIGILRYNGAQYRHVDFINFIFSKSFVNYSQLNNPLLVQTQDQNLCYKHYGVVKAPLYSQWIDSNLVFLFPGIGTKFPDETYNKTFALIPNINWTPSAINASAVASDMNSTNIKSVIIDFPKSSPIVLEALYE